jgi:hypothetical protein
MPNPGSLYSCRGPNTYAVSWNQIVNSSYHKNSPDPVERVTGLPTTWMLLTPSQGKMYNDDMMTTFDA